MKIGTQDHSHVRSNQNKEKTEKRKAQPNQSSTKIAEEAMASHKENMAYASTKSLPKSEKKGVFAESPKKSELRRIMNDDGKSPKELREEIGLTHTRLKKEDRERLNS